jgi:(p)ppGpp synthase/HD superfamily hydrolase
MEFLHTSFAKSQLTRFLKSQHKEDLLQQAISGLNKHLEDLELPLFGAPNDKISSCFEKKLLENKLMNVLSKTEKYSHIIRTAYPQERRAAAKERNQIKHRLKTILDKSSSSVVVDYDKILDYQLCPECSPRT